MKVVVVYASSGLGHKRAAEALVQALQAAPGISLQLIDSLDYTHVAFRYLYPRIYLFLVKYLPAVWGFFYQGFNIPAVAPWLQRARRLLNAANGKALERFLVREEPEVVVSTHFFASEVASALKRNGRLKARLVTVITDLAIHTVWIAAETDLYVVGSSETRASLIKRGVSDEKIALFGIPVDPRFEEEKDRLSLLQKQALSSERFTVLVASGGFGIGPIERLVSVLIRKPELQLLVVCGHNRPLYERLVSRNAGVRERVKIYGFVQNMDELMAMSDCLVSKSGGLMMTEALAKGLPMLIFRPIPGQEQGNQQVLLRHQAALSAGTLQELEAHFSDLEHLKERLSFVRKQMEMIRQHQAARRTADFITEIFS